MRFQTEIAEAIARQLSLEPAEVEAAMTLPPDPTMGDLAYPCFKLAKVLRKNPAQIATDLAAALTGLPGVAEITTKGAYVNLTLDKTALATEVLSEVARNRDDFGRRVANGKTVVIDYSSPNIAKPFHVGHLRSTVIGGALYRIYGYLGYHCVGINHLGDWGTQFGKLIVAYKKWGSREAVEKDGITELLRIYVKFHDEAEKDPSLDDEARAWFVKMQEKDPEALSLWQWFKDISMKEFERVYHMLGVTFDSYAGESFYNDKMEAVVDELKEKGLLKESQGAMIVDLEDAGMPPCLILRKDGGTLYATRDLAAAFYRKQTYHFDKCLYLTATDQILHFAQWFKVVEKMGYDWANQLVHVPFGLVSLPNGKLSTRKGNVVLMEDLLNQAVARTQAIIAEKNPDLPNKEEVAQQVGIGAVIFDDLYNGRKKEIVFDWDRMLNFDGETGPYVQYTHARTCSLLKKMPAPETCDFGLLTDPASVAVVKLLDAFPAKIEEAADKNEPFVISRHIVDLAQAFNKFYHDNPILSSEPAVRNARLFLTACVETVLRQGLWLLGIQAPEQM